jgi:hypothetical protein
MLAGCSRGRSASNAISERGDLTPADSKCIHDIAQQVSTDDCVM